MIIAIVSAALFAVVVVVIGVTLCVVWKMKKSQMDPPVLYNSLEEQRPALIPQDS